MINTNIHDEQNVISIMPVGKVSEAEFDALANTINRYINERDQVPGLVIEARHLPHWDSFSAFLRHMKFIKNHHKVVKKVAIVGDGHTLQILPSLVDHFVSAKLRHYRAEQVADAIAWAAAADDHPGEFEILNDLPMNVVGVKAKGTITAQDYETTLNPLIRDKLETYDQLNLVFIADDDFESFSAGAAWDDAKLGMMHINEFGKIALVTNIGWIRRAAKLFGPLWPGQVHVFDNDDLDSAKQWVSA